MWQKFRNSEIPTAFSKYADASHGHCALTKKQGYYSSGLSPRLTRHFGLDLDRPTPFGALSRSLG